VREGYYHDSSGGGGVKLMPSDWHRGSYRELEVALAEMRTNGCRPLWYHAVRRYRDATRATIEVLVRRTRRGPLPLLPQNAELVGGAVIIGARHARVIVRRWAADVDQQLADAGVEHLVRTMYGGRRERIVLPPAIAAVAFAG
jgi:hypothetical protein